MITSTIKSILDIPMAVLMGANLAAEVADEEFCETTIGCKDESLGTTFKSLFQTPNFRYVQICAPFYFMFEKL